MENEKSIRLVEATGKQRGTITASYVEDVTRVGTVVSAESRVNVSRDKAQRKLCREGSRLRACEARKYGMVVESQEERVEIIATRAHSQECGIFESQQRNGRGESV